MQYGTTDAPGRSIAFTGRLPHTGRSSTINRLAKQLTAPNQCDAAPNRFAWAYGVHPRVMGDPVVPGLEPPEEPYRHLVFGNTTEEGPEPHIYTIWNHDDEPRTIAVRIVRNGTEIHTGRHEFPARATLNITFKSPANYTMTLSVVGSNHSQTLADSLASFDCNRMWGNVAILEGGAIRVETYQTKIGCS